MQRDQPLEKCGQDRAQGLYLLEAPTGFFEPQELCETLLALENAKVQAFRKAALPFFVAQECRSSLPRSKLSS